MTDELLTVAEVAERLKLNPQTVYNWISAGSLPAARIGRGVRVRREDFDTLAGSTNFDSAEADLLTVAEVADLLKLNQQTVRNWIDGGRMPAIRIGRRVRIRRQDLDAILEAGSTGSAVMAAKPAPTASDFWSGEPVGEVMGRA
jgi:excisionase family DNA binding protein